MQGSDKSCFSFYQHHLANGKAESTFECMVGIDLASMLIFQLKDVFELEC